MNKKRWSWRETLLFVVPLFLLAVPFLPRLVGIDWGELRLMANPLARARENARRSSCQSNLKQIGLGLALYIQDFDQKYPLNTATSGGWEIQMTAYTKSCPIQICPSDTSKQVFLPGSGCATSYWMNANFFDKWSRGIKATTIKNAARSFMSGDGDSSVGFPTYVLNQKTWNPTAPYASRHLNGANYLFADGHVAWMRAEAVAVSKNADPGGVLGTFRVK
jgi:prepilin-type processing-associated H-X9-DG protein